MTGLISARDLDWHPPPLAPDYRSSILRSPAHARLHYHPTETEMTGPTFGHNMLGALDDNLILNYANPGEAAIGPRIHPFDATLRRPAQSLAGQPSEQLLVPSGGANPAA